MLARSHRCSTTRGQASPRLKSDSGQSSPRLDANPQIWKIFVKNPCFFVNTKDTSIFTIFMKITSFPCDWMILEDRFEHFPDTPSSKFSRIHGFGRFSYLLEPLQRQPSLRIPSGTWSFLLPFLRKKVHFREFRAHFRIIVFIRCAFVIHCCSILATKRPSARPFGPPSESVLNMDSFRNVVIFGQKGTFLGIPCSCPNASFLGGQRLLGDFCR